MNDDKLIRKIQTDCPLCDKVHEIEQRIRITKTIIKGEEIEYEEIYYFCQNSDEDENEFVTSKLESENLKNARNTYRQKHGLLTSDEIVAIRNSYGLSQVELAKLLGWGEATISRYESKAIQDEVYDDILRIIKENPLSASEFFQKNSAKFKGVKKLEIKQKILDNLDAYGKEYIKRQALESEYINYQEPCDANGYQKLNIDKLESMVSYFAEKVSNLYKVKLMKMLWYADSLHYKMNKSSMTGLVYIHEKMGALPIGHYRIIDLENIVMQEEESYECTKYHFFSNEKLNLSNLSNSEIEILDAVTEKFKTFKSSDIVNYMHDETAYTKTNTGDIIPFSLAKEIRPF